MAQRFLAFDIEVAKEFPIEAPDWTPYRPLGISCAATLEADAPKARTWHGVDARGRPSDRMSREECAALADYLRDMAGRGFSILTWNGLGFDFDVLAEESGMAEECRELATAHVDMMFHAFCLLGFPIGLDAAAKGMGLPGKPAGMSGIMAPGLWAEGKRQQVLDYVAQDVRTTLDVALACQRAGRLAWITRQGKPRDVRLPDGWLPVHAAVKLPEPDTSWMTQPLARGRFLAWMGPKRGPRRKR